MDETCDIPKTYIYRAICWWVIDRCWWRIRLPFWRRTCGSSGHTVWGGSFHSGGRGRLSIGVFRPSRNFAGREGWGVIIGLLRFRNIFVVDIVYFRISVGNNVIVWGTFRRFIVILGILQVTVVVMVVIIVLSFINNRYGLLIHHDQVEMFMEGGRFKSSFQEWTRSVINRYTYALIVYFY